MLGQLSAVIVIFFRTKACGRNSFISTNPYKFAVKKQRRTDGVCGAKTREAECHRKDTGKEWKKKKQNGKENLPETERGTECEVPSGASHRVNNAAVQSTHILSIRVSGGR